MKAIIFDLDGTLINSLEDIAISMNIVLKEFNLKVHKISDYNKFVGDGALVLVKNSLPNNTNNKLVEAALKRFIEVYETTTHNNTKAYEGIYELLDELEKRDIKLNVLSNKPHKFTLLYVESIFKTYKFLEVHGQKDYVPKKPNPKGADNITKALNLKNEEVIFIGDTATDIKTAKAANMKSIGVLWGFRGEKELKEAGADFIAQEPKDILTIIENL